MAKPSENRPDQGPNWAQKGTLVVTGLRFIWDLIGPWVKNLG